MKRLRECCWALALLTVAFGCVACAFEPETGERCIVSGAMLAAVLFITEDLVE